MRYIIFSRVSTKKQITENQLFECRQWVNSKITPDDEIIEFDEKAQTTMDELDKRPVLLETLKFLKRGDTLVIYKLSRLARGHELSMIYDKLVKKMGVILVSMYESKIDDMLIHAYAMIGAAERINIQNATRTGLNRKKHAMEKTGTAKYGYKTDPEKLQTYREDCHSYGKPYLLVEDDNESKQVELMIDWFAKGCSYGQIAHELENAGFQNRKGKPVTKMTVYRVLQRLGKQRQAPKAEQLEMSQ